MQEIDYGNSTIIEEQPSIDYGKSTLVKDIDPNRKLSSSDLLMIQNGLMHLNKYIKIKKVKIL